MRTNPLTTTAKAILIFPFVFLTLDLLAQKATQDEDYCWGQYQKLSLMVKERDKKLYEMQQEKRVLNQKLNDSKSIAEREKQRAKREKTEKDRAQNQNQILTKEKISHLTTIELQDSFLLALNNDIDGLRIEKNLLERQTDSLSTALNKVQQENEQIADFLKQLSTKIFIEYKVPLRRRVFYLPVGDKRLNELKPSNVSKKEIKPSKIRAKRVQRLIVISDLLNPDPTFRSAGKVVLKNKSNEVNLPTEIKFKLGRNEPIGNYYLIKGECKTEKLSGKRGLFRKWKNVNILTPNTNYEVIIEVGSATSEPVTFFLD